MKKITLLFTAFFFAFTANAFTVSNNSLGGLARVYGYLLGQEQSLKIIEISYPELQQDVLLARLKFQASYPDIKVKAATKIIELVGEQGKELISKMEQQIDANAAKIIPKNQAIEFLKTVQNRAEGKIENQSTRDFMLAITYFDNPGNEIAEKKTVKFNTKNEVKAKGLDLTITLPLSWLEQEGNTPNSIRTWKSEAGSGKSLITFLVYNSGDTKSKEQVKNAIASKKLFNMVPSKATVNKIIYSEISNQAGWYSETELVQQRLDLDIYMINKNVYALYEGKTIEIGCSSGDILSKKEDVIKEAKRVESLCRAVLLSLVINNVYQ
jgi:hypothetical protein